MGDGILAGIPRDVVVGWVRAWFPDRVFNCTTCAAMGSGETCTICGKPATQVTADEAADIMILADTPPGPNGSN